MRSPDERKAKSRQVLGRWFFGQFAHEAWRLCGCSSPVRHTLIMLVTKKSSQLNRLPR